MSLSLLLIASTSFADVKLPKLMSDGVILQRDTSTSIWGWAEEGETVEVSLNDELLGKTSTRNGEWQIMIGAQSAGGPHQLKIVGTNSIEINDVYFGDIWIASGQSNMELPMERVKEKYQDLIATADYPLIRQFKVNKTYDFNGPVADFPEGKWVQTTPDSVLDFSAVGFFFAHEISETQQVPVGIITNAFGGAAAESWMSEEALEAYPHYLEVARSYRKKGYLQALLDADQKTASEWSANVDANDPGIQETPRWWSTEYDDKGWQTFTVPGFWADTETGPVNGAFWFRKDFDVPAELAGSPAKLMLGAIVDADTTYINGQKVGNTTYKYPPRRYEIPENVLRAGTNTIAIRVINSSGSGGFIKNKPYTLTVRNTVVDLEGAWRFRVGAESPAIAPPGFIQHRQPMGIHNAMLAPLFRMTIKGVIWYQGETNVGRSDEYKHLFPAMIRDWRKSWQQGDFPFIFVQLANFLEAQPEPVESAWAELRNAQLLSLSAPNTAMVVAIDVGEWNDIHPLDKKTVGERLALAARSIAYGETGLVSSGPVFSSMQARDNKLVIEFEQVGSGLTLVGKDPVEFAIAGSDGVYTRASAKLEDNRLVVWNKTISNPVFIRYAWADNPDGAKLYNLEGLPASPFQARLQTHLN